MLIILLISNILVWITIAMVVYVMYRFFVVYNKRNPKVVNKQRKYFMKDIPDYSFRELSLKELSRKEEIKLLLFVHPDCVYCKAIIKNISKIKLPHSEIRINVNTSKGITNYQQQLESEKISLAFDESIFATLGLTYIPYGIVKAGSKVLVEGVVTDIDDINNLIEGRSGDQTLVNATSLKE